MNSNLRVAGWSIMMLIAASCGSDTIVQVGEGDDAASAVDVGGADVSRDTGWDVADDAGAGCTLDDDCAAAERCVEGVCVPAALPDGVEGGSCYGNGTCNDGLTCLDGTCVASGSEGTPCVSNAECLPDLRCVAGVCEPAGDDGPHHREPGCGAVVHTLRSLSHDRWVGIRWELAPAALALISVTDCEGRPVTGLAATDLAVLEDGRPASVEAGGLELVAAQSRTRLTVMVALDLSSSTLPIVDDVIGAARSFVDALEDSGAVAAVGVLPFAGDPLFNPGATEFVPGGPGFGYTDLLLPTDDFAVVRDYLDRQATASVAGDRSATNLRQAIAAASQTAQTEGHWWEVRADGGGVSVPITVVFTDGRDTAGLDAPRPQSTVLAVALRSADYDPDALADLISPTGIPIPGNVYEVDTAAQLGGSFDDVALWIRDVMQRASYVVGYCSPARDGTHTVDFDVIEASATQSNGFRFEASTSDGTCDARNIVTACEENECGGLLCGGCDDLRGMCVDGRCESWCAVAGVCEDGAILAHPLDGSDVACGASECPRGWVRTASVYRDGDVPGLFAAPVSGDHESPLYNALSDGRGATWSWSSTESEACGPDERLLTFRRWTPSRWLEAPAAVDEPSSLRFSVSRCVGVPAGELRLNHVAELTASHDGRVVVLRGGVWFDPSHTASFAARVDTAAAELAAFDVSVVPVGMAALPDGRWLEWTATTAPDNRTDIMVPYAGAITLHDASGVVSSWRLEDITPDLGEMATAWRGHDVNLCPTRDGRVLLSVAKTQHYAGDISLVALLERPDDGLGVIDMDFLDQASVAQCAAGSLYANGTWIFDVDSQLVEFPVGPWPNYRGTPVHLARVPPDGPLTGLMIELTTESSIVTVRPQRITCAAGACSRDAGVAFPSGRGLPSITPLTPTLFVSSGSSEAFATRWGDFVDPGTAIIGQGTFFGEDEELP